MKLITTEQVNSILNIDDSYKAPSRLMDILLDSIQRENVFNHFLDINSNLEQDCFFQYFQDEHAERKKYAQDFTPPELSILLSKLLGNEGNQLNLDVAAGTGSLTIQKWFSDKSKCEAFQYKPSNYFYQCEELSDRAVPFLLFNLMIRGMNAIVIHGDVLNRSVKNIYFIQNSKDDHLSFSDLNVMPRTKTVEQEFDVRRWIDEPLVHIESELVI